MAAASASSEDDRVTPGGAAAVKRVGLVVWLALVVIVAIWTERRIDHRADAPAREPAPRTATAAATVPHRQVAAAAAPDDATPLRLDGRVIGPDGRDVAGAVVTLDPDASRSTTTDAAGRFSFDPVEPRVYSVTASAARLMAGPIAWPVHDAARPLVIRLAEGASAKVLAVDEAGEPIPDAQVTVRVREWPSTARTDEHGQATLAPLQPGLAFVSVEAPDHAPGHRTISIGAAGNADATITLYRGWPLSGRIIDEHREPIAGARIAVMTGSERLYSAPIRSNERGEFTIPALVRGSYTLDVSDDEHAPIKEPVDVDRTAVRGIEIAMIPGGVITGVVVDDRGNPAPRAIVAANYSGRIWQTTADSDGRFELRGLPSVPLTVRAETAVARSHALAADLSRLPETNLDLVLDLVGAIAGTVVDDRGTPLAGVAVNAYPDYPHVPRWLGQAPTSAQSITDDRGAFALTGLPDLPYLLSTKWGANTPATWPLHGPVAHIGDHVQLTLPSNGRLIGRLLDTTGAPLADVTVQVALTRVVTDHDGAFDLHDVPPGSYDVTFSGRNAFYFTKQGVEIRPGTTTDLGTLTTPRGRILVGRVVDTTGAPVSGAKVELGVIRPAPTDPDDPPAGFHAYLRTSADPDGSFRIGLPPAPMIVIASDLFYDASPPTPIPGALASPGDPPAITLVLRDRR